MIETLQSALGDFVSSHWGEAKWLDVLLASTSGGLRSNEAALDSNSGCSPEDDVFSGSVQAAVWGLAASL